MLPEYQNCFDYLTNLFELVHGRYIIAGGFCFRANHYIPFYLRNDIDIFFTDSNRPLGQDAMDGLQYIETKKFKPYKDVINPNHMSGPIIDMTNSYSFDPNIVYIDTYWCPVLKTKIQMICRNDVFSLASLFKNFDMNVTKYYYDTGKKFIKSKDKYPGEIAVEHLWDGVSFGHVFERITKYKKLCPNRKTTFRLCP